MGWSKRALYAIGWNAVHCLICWSKIHWGQKIFVRNIWNPVLSERLWSESCLFSASFLLLVQLSGTPSSLSVVADFHLIFWRLLLFCLNFLIECTREQVRKAISPGIDLFIFLNQKHRLIDLLLPYFNTDFLF